MRDLDSRPYNSDDEPHDACPTCSAPVQTKATTDAGGHHYRLECESCSWTLPIERPLTATQDDAVLVTDGGVTADASSDGGPQSAQEILDELHHDESVARVAKYIKTGNGRPNPMDVLRTLALAEDRLCITVEHRTGTEYIWLADGWRHFVARHDRDRDEQTVEGIPIGLDDLEKRLERPIDVEIVGSTDVARQIGRASCRERV